MATGILAFCLVGLLGLLSAGLGTMRESSDSSATTLIAQRLIGECQQGAMTNLADLPARYFDVDGQEIVASGTYVYDASVTVRTPVAIGNAAESANLAKITVEIRKNKSAESSRSIVGYVSRN